MRQPWMTVSRYESKLLLVWSFHPLSDAYQGVFKDLLHVPMLHRQMPNIRSISQNPPIHTSIWRLKTGIFTATTCYSTLTKTTAPRLFRHKNPEEPLLLIYRDEPCVIIGRNQNPWKEVNFQALHARPGVPFIRRRSGGGTVYHVCSLVGSPLRRFSKFQDMGNTNFSIHLPRHSFDRHVTAQIVLRAVRSLGIDARVNDRNDICVGEEKIGFSRHYDSPYWRLLCVDTFRDPLTK